ncbi:major facilitator superfamily domain-containing protein [Mycena filopes]|nr:major facilitator superfamily domain-containing protein [Mycena filopes]
MAEKITVSDHDGSQPQSSELGPKDTATVEPVPDGGLGAWAAVAGGFMIYMAGLGYFNAYGVYQDFYVREFMTKYSPAEIAWIGSCQIAIQFVLGLPVGKLFDAGYFRLPHLLLLALDAQPRKTESVFLTQGVGMGFGLGLTFLPALGVAAHHFSRRRGLAMGIMTSGASVGGIVFPIMLNHLLFRRGFVVGVRATAALITALMFLANVLIRPRYPKNQPTSKASIRIILTDGPYMIFVAAGLFIMLGIFYPIFYLQLYAIKQGIREKIAFDTISLINAGGVAGRVIPNFLADRVGSFNVIIPVIFLAAGCVLAMLAVALNSGEIIAISLLYGMMNAGFVSMSPALLAELSTDRSEIGTRMGLWFSFTAAAAMAGQPLSGALILGDFRWSTVFAGICLCAGGGLVILSRFSFLRRRLGDARRAS